MQISAMYKILTEMLEILTNLIDSRAAKSKKCLVLYAQFEGNLTFWAFWGKNTIDYETRAMWQLSPNCHERVPGASCHLTSSRKAGKEDHRLF